MSETGTSFPEFTTIDIPTNASENDVRGPETTIISIANSDTDAYGKQKAYNTYDHDLTALRRRELERADILFRQKEYMETISYLKWVLQDLDHAQQLNQSREFEIREVMELCYTLSSRKVGNAALAEVVPLATTPENLPAPSTVVEPIAS